MTFKVIRYLLFVGFIGLSQGQLRAQKEHDKPYERLLARADLYFREGAYEKAINLYTACQNYPYQSDKASLKTTIQKAQSIIRLDNLALAEVRKGNKAKALALMEQILQANPNDPYAKASRKDLQASLIHSLTTQDARLRKRADDLIGKGDWASANTILQLIDAMPTGRKDPQIARKLDMTRQMMASENEVVTALKNRDYNKATRIAEKAKTIYPEAQGSSVLSNIPKVDEQTIKLRNEIIAKASKYMAQCEWDQAEVVLTNARKLPEFSTDGRLKTKLTDIRVLQSNLNNIATWRSDPSKRLVTYSAYEKVFRTHPSCIRENYYNYVIEEAHSKQNNENYAGAILAYSKAKRIFPALAQREQTDQRIALCDSLSKCPDKTKVFNALMATANQQYNACECETSIDTWRSAEKYIATICSNGEANRIKWEDWRKNVIACEQDQLETKRFSTLMNEARQAFDAGSCQEAKQLYQNADKLQTRCGILNKRSIDSALAACEKCIQRQCFDSTYAQAELSLSRNFKRDALEYYRRALKCPAPEDRKEQLTVKIAALACEIDPKSCPPPKESTDFPGSKTHLIGLYITGSGGLLNPTLYDSSGKMAVRKTPYFAVGLSGDFTPFNGIFSVRIGAQFAQYNLHSTLAGGHSYDKFSISTLRVPIGIRLHTSKLKSGVIRPYLFAEYAFAKPIRFNYTNERLGLSETNSSYAASVFDTMSGGIGIEQNRKSSGFFLELGYQAVINNMFMNSTPIQNQYFSNDRTTIYGINLGLRFK